MTRLLAFSDTQIGVPAVALADQADVLQKIVAVALERNVDAVLHGGDVFEGPVVTPEHLRVFLDGVKPLRDAGIPLLVTRGNGRHDLATRSVHALDVLREIDGIVVADSPTVAILADKVAVCALPWVHPGRLIAQSNGSLTHDAANLTTAELLVRIAGSLRERAEVLTPLLPTVLLAHWAISGSKLPTGLPVDEMREPILPWADLDELGFDVIVGAHIHEPQRLGARLPGVAPHQDLPDFDKTTGFVCGSPQQLNFGEGGLHGCWIVNFDAPELAEFVPLRSRRFVTVNFESPPFGETPMPEVLPGDIVRIRYVATDEEARRVDHAELRRVAEFVGASRVQIEPTIIRQQRARAEHVSDDLAPADALAAYCEAQEIEGSMRDRMLRQLEEWGAE